MDDLRSEKVAAERAVRADRESLELSRGKEAAVAKAELVSADVSTESCAFELDHIL